MSGRKLFGIVFVAMLLASGVARAEPPFGVSSYELHEQQRLQAIASQIGTQEHLRWLSGLSSRIWSGRRYSLESIYAGLASYGLPTPWRTDVFEPWPRVPGDIYGRQYDRASPQPSGHRITPLGPNGYVYEPTYGFPAPPALAPVFPAGPAVPDPGPARPPLAEELPPPQSSTELREF